MNIDPIFLSFVSVGLALTAVSLGFIQFFRTPKIVKSLLGQSERLTDITGALSTKYIAAFPKYFEDVQTLVQTAEHSIIIVTNMPTPNFFTNWGAWQKLSNTLRIKSSGGVTVEVLSPNSKLRCLWLRDRFGKESKDWDIYQKDNKDKISALYKRYLENNNLDATMLNETFLDDLCKCHEKALSNELQRSDASFLFVDQTIPLGFYLVDGVRAMFFVKCGYPDVSHGFSTTDPQFILALKSLYEEYKVHAVRVNAH